MTTDMGGQRVLVTGASSGIGAGLAEEFARRGAVVGICARRGDRLDEVLARCRAYSPSSRRWVTDLSDPAAVDKLAADALEELGGRRHPGQQRRHPEAPPCDQAGPVHGRVGDEHQLPEPGEAHPRPPAPDGERGEADGSSMSPRWPPHSARPGNPPTTRRKLRSAPSASRWPSTSGRPGSKCSSSTPGWSTPSSSPSPTTTRSSPRWRRYRSAIWLPGSSGRWTGRIAGLRARLLRRPGVGQGGQRRGLPRRHGEATSPEQSDG